MSDLCGEKLSEAFVQAAIGDDPGFAMLAPLADGRGYAVFLDAERCDHETAALRADRIERRLGENPHDAHARRLGQLAPLQAIRVADPMPKYYQMCMDRGQRIGEIKPAALRTESCWEEILTEATSTAGANRPAGVGILEAGT